MSDRADSPLSPSDMLAHVGRALHGPEWQSPLGRDIEVSRETIRRMLKGSQSLSADHGIFVATARAVRLAAETSRDRAEKLGRIAVDLDRWIAEQNDKQA